MKSTAFPKSTACSYSICDSHTR